MDSGLLRQTRPLMGTRTHEGRRRRERLDRATEVVFCQTCETKTRTGCGRTCQRERTVRVEHDAAVSSRARPLDHHSSRARAHPDRRTARRFAEREEITELLPKRCRKRAQAGAI
jgi:hypothetical protein